MTAQTNGHHASAEARQDAGSSIPPCNGTGNSDATGQHTSPIAIIGMSCKFGGEATSPTKLWDLCAAGKDGWSPIPSDRFAIKSMYHPDSQRFDRVSLRPLHHICFICDVYFRTQTNFMTVQHHVKGGYFLKDDIAAFDAGFFGLSAESCSVRDICGLSR